MTAVIHGCKFVHWATIWVGSGEITTSSYCEECRAQENTPDFIFTHFIELFCDVTGGAPRDWELESAVMAIQQTTLRVVLKLETLQYNYNHLITINNIAL